MTYEEAVSLALKGDERGFEFLYDRTKDELYYTLLKDVKNEELAKDILQDSYIKAWQRLSTLQDASKFKSWLYTIALNTMRTELSKQKRNPLDLRVVPESEDDSDFSELDWNVSEWENLPELSYSKEETRQLVQEILDTLPEEQKLVILAVLMGEMKAREVAEITGWPVSTVKSRLNSGEKKIREKIEELQKKGYQILSVAPIAFLFLLLQKDKEVFAAERTTTAALAACKAKIGEGNASGSAGASSAAKTATTNTAAAKGLLATTAGKVVVGVAAAAILGGATIAAINLPNKDKTDAPVVSSDQQSGKIGYDVSDYGTPSQDTSQDTSMETEANDLDPYFNYEERFELDNPGSFGVSGSLNEVNLKHVEKLTGKESDAVGENWEINSVTGYVMVDMILYKEKAARDAGPTSNGNAYTMSPINYIEIPNGTSVYVESGITIDAKYVWGVQANGETVTIYKVSSDYGDGYLLQNAFNGSPSDVNKIF